MPSGSRESPEKAVCTLLLVAVSTLAGAQGTEFESLAQASTIQQLVRDERQRGNAEAAWILEHELLGLALRHPDDVRSARILRNIGDYRVDILGRYEAGEFPPEIVLGCYYNYDDTSQYGFVSRQGSQTVFVSPGGAQGSVGCASGSYSRARQALAADALWFYIESARLLLSNKEAGSDEVRELLMKLLASSYKNSNYRVGRWSLDLLRSYQETNSASWLTKAQTHALMGDWDLLFARHFGTKYRDSALVQYEQAIALLSEHGIADDPLFSPQTPILLPTFATNPLMSEQTADSIGYVDIAFEIREDGRTKGTKIIDSSGNAPRSAQRDLVNTIRNGRFRPIAANDRLLDSAPVTVRYYFSD